MPCESCGLPGGVIRANRKLYSDLAKLKARVATLKEQLAEERVEHKACRKTGRRLTARVDSLKVKLERAKFEQREAATRSRGYQRELGTARLQLQAASVSETNR